MSSPDAIADLIRAAGVDPAAGLQLVAADRLPAVPFEPSLPLLILPGIAAEAAATVPGRHARHGPIAVLRALYPGGHALHRLRDGQHVPLEDLDEAALGGTPGSCRRWP